MKQFAIYPLSFLTWGFILFSCKKESNKSPQEIIVSKNWKRGILDKNQSSNPSAYNTTVIYHPVPLCEQDDVLTFSKNDSLTINPKNNLCSISDSITRHSYMLVGNKLIIDGTSYTLAEISESQIKYYSIITSNSSASYMVYLLQ